MEIAKICGKNESSILEIVKKEKEMCARFAVASPNATVMATVHNKSVVKFEKALSLWVEDINRERPHLCDFYYTVYCYSSSLLLIFYCAKFLN